MDISSNKKVKNIIPITPDVKWNEHCVLQATILYYFILNGMFSSIFLLLQFFFFFLSSWLCCLLFLLFLSYYSLYSTGVKCKKKKKDTMTFIFFLCWSFFRRNFLFMQEQNQALGVEKKVNILSISFFYILHFKKEKST